MHHNNVYLMTHSSYIIVMNQAYHFISKKSFLSNRKQYVSINGFNSDNQDITCGVPQGSNLGPLLFLLYITEFRVSLCQSNSNHFADDTSILFSSSKLKTIESILNYDLKCASIWFRANRLSLNVSKSKLLFFHSKQKKIDYSKIYILNLFLLVW